MAVESGRVQMADDHARRVMVRRIRGIVRSILIHSSLIPAAFVFTLPFLWML